MLKKRGAGVLLHISSMPSEYGVGVFDDGQQGIEYHDHHGGQGADAQQGDGKAQ